jgi:cytochrome d ubiquinol oxidase subunit I
VWETEKSAPLTLFAWPNEAQRRNDFAITIPKAASLILTHRADGEIRGLAEFPGNHPPVAPLFWGFRIMVGLGFAMLAISWAAAWQWKRRCAIPDWMARVLTASTFIGWLAVLAGWYVTEIGRQPWLVYGVLSVANAAADKTSADIGISFVLYLVAYAVLLPSFVAVVFHLARRASEARA